MNTKLKSIWTKVGPYGVLAVLQYLAIVAFNIRYTANSIETDSGKIYRHVIEMSRNHTLFIKNWNYATTMELDSSALLAAPIYTLTHDVYLSCALASAIFLLFFLYVIVRLFDRFNISLKTAIMACNLIMIPYAFGMLDYFNMLMFGGCEYYARVMIPFLALTVLMTPKEKRIKPENIILCTILVIIVLLASISNGIYVLVSCIVPVVFAMAYNVFRADDLKKYDFYQYVLSATLIVLSVVGLACSKLLGAAEIGNSMNLLRWYDLRYYRDCFVEGFFRLMGAMPGAIEGEDVPVVSLRGIAFLVKLLISIMIIGVQISGIRYTIIQNKRDIRFYLVAISLINAFIVMVCETRYNSLNTTLEYRYLLPVVVPMIVAIPVEFEMKKEDMGKYLRNFIYGGFVIAVAFTTMVCFMDAHDGLDTYAYCNQIVEYVEGTEYETVIFMDDRPTSDVCRAKDLTRKYASYTSNYRGMDIVDFYKDAFYASYYDQAHLFLTIQGTNIEEALGSDLASLYTYRESILWFDIYEAQEFKLVE